jgi:hypothetical protein
MSGLRIATLSVSAVLLFWEILLLVLNLTAIIALLKYFNWVNLLLFTYFVLSALCKLAASVMGAIAAIFSFNPSNFLP